LKKALSLLFLAVLLLATAWQTRWLEDSDVPIIQTDGQGYYAYLPAVFIYHDLSFGFVEEINENYYQPDKRAAYIFHTPSGITNKYFIGTAVIQAPFFLIAHGVASVTGYPADGYSKPYQLAVAFAAIFSLCIGLWFLSGFLSQLGFDWKTTAITSVLSLFATNLLYYTLYEPSMSHVYSFCTVSAFLFFSTRVLNEAKVKAVIGMAIAFGLTVLIRPTNGIILLALPAVTGGLFNLISSLETLFKSKYLWLSILIAVGIVSIQPLVYYLQTGSPFVWSYSDEGFNFLAPEIYNVLFSYRKGLFVYSPILLLGVVGIFAGLKKRKEGFGWLLFLLGVSTWIIASWWMWFYGGSFGHRAFIEYIPFFAIGLAYLIQFGWGMLRPWLIVLICILFTGISIVQTYQYVENILPFDGMSKEKYWNLFMLTDSDLAWYYYPGNQEYRAIDSLMITHDMETQLSWGNEHQITERAAKNGVKSALMKTDMQYGPTIVKEIGDLSVNVNLVRIGAWVKTDTKRTDLALVCTLEDSTGTSYYWNRYMLKPQIKGADKWSWSEAVFKCGTPRAASDKFVIYPMKSDPSEVYIDDIEISFINAAR